MLVCSVQVLNCMLRVVEGGFDVEVDSIDQGSLFDDELVELFVNLGEGVDRLDEIFDFLVLEIAGFLQDFILLNKASH